MANPSSNFQGMGEEGMTGMDRVLQMYSLGEFGSLSPELLSTYQATFLGTFIGATYGGLISMRNTNAKVKDSKEVRQAIAFKPQTVTYKPTPDSIVRKFGKGAFSWGWRLGLLGGSGVLISSTVSVYRGKSGLLEYVIAGGIIGTLSQANQGVKAVAAGAVIGTAIGTLGGCVAYGISRVRGATIEENRFWQYGWRNVQLKPSKEVVKRLQEEEESILRSEKEITINKTVKKEAEFITDEPERQALVWR